MGGRQKIVLLVGVLVNYRALNADSKVILTNLPQIEIHQCNLLSPPSYACVEAFDVTMAFYHSVSLGSCLISETFRNSHLSGGRYLEPRICSSQPIDVT